MFIPIDAKADIPNSKKGKLTPAQHAQLNAWCLADKTGILDCLGKIMATAKTFTAAVNEANIEFNSGYLVICGRLVQCEQGTTVKITTPTTGVINGKIVARFELSSSGEEEFKVIQKVGVLEQEDLNEHTNGNYDFVLYEYEATPNTVTLKDRTVPYVPDIGGKLAQFEASLKDEGKPLHGYDDSKGTIEERLTKLGFKEGSVTLSSGTATVNRITRQGNYCILMLNASRFNINIKKGDTIFTIPDGFRPLSNVECYVAGKVRVDNDASALLSIELRTNGAVVFVSSIDFASSSGTRYVREITYAQIGYEAQPIQ